MFCRTSILVRMLLLIAASVLLCAVMAAEIPELVSLTDDTSNDFTIHKADATAYALMLSIANFRSLPMNPKSFEDDEDIRHAPAFEDAGPSSVDSLLHSVLRT
jgi:hypothetical protein